MQSIGPLPIYTFIGVRADGSQPAMDVVACADFEAALRCATAWLGEHPSCERAQVWSDADLVGEVQRSPPSSDPVSPNVE